MQLKRSYFRRVKVLRSYIYEQGLNARRAYCSIRLAVKTSRPLVESPRIELGSKQAIKELSTRLFPDWIFVILLGQKQPQNAYLF
jgi:hypothetical protein